MPDIKFAHAGRLYESLLECTDEKTAERIATCAAMGAAPSAKRREEWARGVCDALESRFDGETVKKIRMACACGPSKARLEALRKYYLKHGTLEAVALKFSQEGAPSWVEGDSLLISYPRCYCSCVKGSDGLLPKSYCYCGVGYTKRNLEYALGCEVDAELIQSVKSGGDRCLMRVVRA